MRFFLDHDVPEEAAHLLRHHGHEVIILRDVLPITALDEEAFAYAIDQDLITVTCNRNEFLALAAIQEHPGLIILVRRQTRQAECGRLLSLLRRAGAPGLARNINFA